MDANLPVTIRTVRTTVNASIDCKLSNRLFEFGTFPLLQRQSMDWRRTSKCSLLEGNLMFELLDPELQSTIFHVLIESLSVPIWNREKIWSKFEVYLLRLLNWKFRAKSGESILLADMVDHILEWGSWNYLAIPFKSLHWRVFTMFAPKLRHRSVVRLYKPFVKLSRWAGEEERKEKRKFFARNTHVCAIRWKGSRMILLKFEH